MNRMWSPWRSRHIERMTHDADDDDARSVFVRIAAEPERDEANFVLWRGAHAFVLLNLYPYNNGHLMVVPYREEADYAALTPAERAEMGELTAAALGWLRAALRPDGFNVGMNLGSAGGAGIPGHLHQHVVPRWSGDTNFMPTVGDVKVVPEAMADTYRKLRAAVRAWAANGHGNGSGDGLGDPPPPSSV